MVRTVHVGAPTAVQLWFITVALELLYRYGTSTGIYMHVDQRERVKLKDTGYMLG